MVYHSELTVLRCSSGTVTTWPALQKKQATIGFEVICPQITFVGLGLGSKAYTVDCCFVSGSYAQIHDESPVTILQTPFEASPLYYFQYFFAPIDTNLFLSVCQIVWHSTRTNLFYLSSCNIECMLVEGMPKDASIWRYLTCRSCQFTHGINVLWHNGCFRLLATVVHNWSH